MAVHHLKIRPEFLNEKIAGKKLFEIRENDRAFQVGDTVIYNAVEKTDIPPVVINGVEYCGGFTYVVKKEYRYKITYITDFEQKERYVVFGERFISSEERHTSEVENV